jgi:hypothetical protein
MNQALVHIARLLASLFASSSVTLAHPRRGINAVIPLKVRMPCLHDPFSRPTPLQYEGSPCQRIRRGVST